MLFTTRAVERDFGLLKMLLEKNRETRVILLFAQLLIRNSSIQEVNIAANLLDDDTRVHANRLLCGTTKSEQIDALYFSKFMLDIDKNINVVASLRLNLAIREHL